MSDAQTLVLGQWATFGGVLVTALITIIQHRWSETSRRRREQEAETLRIVTAAQLQTDLVARAEALRSALEIQQQAFNRGLMTVASELAGNTRLTEHAVKAADHAYDAANNVNLKIATLGLERLQATADRNESMGQRLDDLESQAKPPSI